MTIIFSFLEDQCVYRYNCSEPPKNDQNSDFLYDLCSVFLLTAKAGGRPGAPALILLDDLCHSELLAE